MTCMLQSNVKKILKRIKVCLNDKFIGRIKMAKLKSDIEVLNVYSDSKKSEILSEILEQVDLVGEDGLNTLGCYILSVLKKNCLIFQDGILTTK